MEQCRQAGGDPVVVLRELCVPNAGLPEAATVPIPSRSWLYCVAGSHSGLSPLPSPEPKVSFPPPCTSDLHVNIRTRDGEGLCLPGKSGQSVQHLHGGYPRESVSLRAEVRDPFQLQPHVLPVLHPAVEVCQAV